MLATMLFFSLYTVRAQEGAIDKSIHKTTVTYSTKDTVTLKMDIYSNDPITVKKPCIVFVFGGGFATGQRDAAGYFAYFNALAKHNFKVVSIDYRLGLQGGKKVSPLNTKPLKEAIDMAVTDLYDATAYLIKHAETLGIDSSAIILSGSSAGAITALQADWEKRNEHAIAQILPESFQYKGVVAFAGAILSYRGAPTYKIPPAPTMLYHGTKDKIVPFNRVRFFNKIFCGSNYLAYRFEAEKYPYYFRVMHRMGHEVASTPMHQHIDEVLWFLDEYVIKGKQYLVQVDFNDLAGRRVSR
ncbi:alpha/beta hydrolase [Filimonas lacunae]|uniref:alpha/beta hydrolase n=1 Tax=Filimonas lacunae TaxID=477680 RepID=UPI0013565E80|nr:carboxylesterase family protein [Filimonas lacunae]